MDPVFNDTSTYEPEYTHPSPADGWASKPHAQAQGQGPEAMRGAVMDDKPNFYPANPGTESLAAAPAPPVVPVSQGLATTSELENATEPSRVPERLDEEDKGSKAGVNFQSLLDNLSAPSLAEDSSLHQAPDESLSQGLPARPAQDPNYPSHDSHQPLPPAPAAPAYATQSNHTSQSLSQSMAPGGAPGTAVGAGSLPPPPIATFQHTPSSVESQSSQENAAQSAKKGKTDKPVVRPGKGADEDTPWGPEVQKKYDEFLHDERIYVTEGLWDRFPIGSRLFVGKTLPCNAIAREGLD